MFIGIYSRSQVSVYRTIGPLVSLFERYGQALYLVLFYVKIYLCLPPSVRPSVRHKLCPLYNLKTVKDFLMKLGTLVNHDETMCRAQEP